MKLRISPESPIPLSILADPLVAAIVISLFCDARAGTDFSGDPRGWWGDVLSAITGDTTGSLLWLISRAKNTQETLEEVRDYAEKALKWLLDDGIAKKLTVMAAGVKEQLQLVIIIDGSVLELEVIQ